MTSPCLRLSHLPLCSCNAGASVYRTFVISSVCGAGKSTAIASLRAAGRLDALYLCRANDEGRRDPGAIVRTIAFQLALSVPAVRSA